MLPSFWNQLVPSRSTHILSFLDFLICEIDQHIKPCFSVQRVHIKPSQPKKNYYPIHISIDVYYSSATKPFEKKKVKKHKLKMSGYMLEEKV
jgi:hypothetical protein